jgi:segregation and condensation protein A
MDDRELTVKLDLFEGPLDLLLFLIRKDELDIYDIPISAITEQYLEYLDLMQTLNVNVASDFLAMAATLVHIKSRLLLPSSSLNDEEEDPRAEIVRPLLEYLQIRKAATRLGERDLLNRDVFVRDFIPEELSEAESESELMRVSLYDLLAAFKKIMEVSGSFTGISLPPERTTVQEKIEHVLNRLREAGSLLFTQLFDCSVNREDLVVTFLALLELVRLGLVRVFQLASNGSIRIFLHSREDTEVDEHHAEM